MLSNLFNVCKKAEDTHKALQHACVDCVYFNNNDFVTCAVHPLTAPQRTDFEAWKTNKCNDWELKK